MLRPALQATRSSVSLEVTRSYSKTAKVAQVLLTKAERMKLYNKETKYLLGPLVQKKKKQNTVKAENSSTPVTVASTAQTKPVQKNHNAYTGGILMNQSRNMWSKKSGQLGLKVACASGLKTKGQSNAAQKPSAVQPGLASDDKILQIKPHRNDYSREYPSVTLILNKTMTEESKAALEKWKQERIVEMGEEEFNKYYEAQMAVGTNFHATLKRYFTEPQHKLAIEKDVEPVWNSVSDLLKSISSPKAIESNVVHPVLKYRGIFDAIADYEEKPTLIEWKKSDKPRKSIALTYDNPIQLAAYFGAVSNDLNYKHLNVRDALLVIAYTDGSKADFFHLTVDKLREHWAHWLVRLENYTKNHASDTEKILKGGKRLFEEDIGNLQ